MVWRGSETQRSTDPNEAPKKAETLHLLAQPEEGILQPVLKGVPVEGADDLVPEDGSPARSRSPGSRAPKQTVVGTDRGPQAFLVEIERRNSHPSGVLATKVGPGAGGAQVDEAVLGSRGIEAAAAEHDVATRAYQSTTIDLFRFRFSPPALLDRPEERIGFLQVAAGSIRVVPVDSADESGQPLRAGHAVVIGKRNQVSLGSADSLVSAPSHPPPIVIEDLDYLVG